MKHIIKILLISLFVCLLCAITLTACEETKVPSEGLWMEHYDDINGYMVKSIGSCKDTDLVIPSEYNGKPVVAIADAAFYQNKTITSVTLPESIRSIGHWAFAHCPKLTKVNMTNGMQTIGEFAFIESIKLEKITLPDSVNSIGRNAFDDTAYYHAEKNWQNGALYIGKHLIEGDYNITTCTVKDGTITIAENAFFNHQKLKEIYIPESVTSVGKTVFGGCTSLEKISCQAASQPAGWHAEWNNGIASGAEVIWNQ